MYLPSTPVPASLMAFMWALPQPALPAALQGRSAPRKASKSASKPRNH